MPTDESTGLEYTDNKTPNLNLELPFSDNKLIIDVDRLVRTIYALDTFLGNLAEVALTGDYNDLLNTPDLEALKQQAILDAHPVGSYYISNESTSPETLFGGTWERVYGRFVLGQSENYTLGSTGGTEITTLTVENLPSHNHTVTVASNGAHTHTANSAGSHAHTTNTAGSHTHTRGTMDITGTIQTPDDVTPSGAFYRIGYEGTEDGGKGSQQKVGFRASRSWSGATSSAGGHTHTVNSAGAHTHSTTSNGAHSHTATCAKTGSGSSFSNMPPYVVAYIWRRTA